MTLQEFALLVITDPAYRQSVIARAAAGTLPEDVELAILDAAANRIAPARPLSVVPFTAVEKDAR